MVELKIQGVAGEVEAAPGLREVAEGEYEAWLLRKVEEAREEIRAGHVVTQEEVEAEAAAWEAEVFREMTPEQRRMVDEVNLDALRFD